MHELVLPTVSVTIEDATMKRISDFFRALQPKRPTAAARPEAAVGNSKLIDHKRLTILDNAWTPPDDFVWLYTERMNSEKLRKYLGRQHISGAYNVFAYFALKPLQSVRPLCTT